MVDKKIKHNDEEELDRRISQYWEDRYDRTVEYLEYEE